MKKLSLITEFDEYYKGSDLQKIVNNNPLPIKYTINGFDCYFFNANLFGLFDWKINKDGITTDDFINDYKNGFIEGLNHLKKVEKIKIKDVDNINTRSFAIKKIQNILFEREFEFGSRGLLTLVFDKIPLIFTEKNIYDFGYWNALIYSIDNLCEITALSKRDLELSDTIAIQLDNTSTPKKVKDYKDTIWFTTGIKLATGEAFDLYEKYKNDKGHFTKICSELGFKESDRTFFSTTINDIKPKVVFDNKGKKLPLEKNNKNTFADKDKLQKLHKELTEKNLPFGAVFLEKYNQIEAE